MRFGSWIVAACLCAMPPAGVSAQQTHSGPQELHTQVLFSGPPAKEPTPQNPGAPVTDAERKAVIITGWKLDVHLAGHDHGLEAHAQVTVSNGGGSPLTVVPLQLSSTLNFEQAGVAEKRVPFVQTTVASDADHTGQLHEAAIRLPEALAAGAAVTIEVDYGGRIPLTAQRLTAIGAPDAAAEATDWDRISDDFTGLRGFGDVVWYPVSSLPASMATGAQLFDEIGRQKLLDQNATMSLRVTDEFSGDAPDVVILDGHYLALDAPSSMPSGAFPGVVTCSIPPQPLGFAVPSLFLARRTTSEANGVRVLAANRDADDAENYLAAGRDAGPILKKWLGNAHEDFTVLELPESGDAPAEAGDVLLTPLSADPPSKLAGIVAHGLANAAFHSDRGWLNEGVANFLETLWVESTDGHTAAMEKLNAARPALALAEPGSPGQGAGQDLLHATSAVYYRTKATYVLWMLSEIAGNKPLQTALQEYRAAQDTRPDYFEGLVEKASGQDLRWFFDNWVYEDRGLPDLSIGGVYQQPEAHQQVLVAVEIANAGYAEAAVPVTLRGRSAALLTEMVRVPAHGQVTHRFTFQEQPVEVDVNDGSVPEVQDSVHQKLITNVNP